MITDAMEKVFIFVLQFFGIIIAALIGWAAILGTLVLIRYLSGLL